MDKCMISVVLSVYNVEIYLEDCIKSLLAQTYQNFEIIIINDGSTDNSGHICKKYEEKNENLFVFSKKNEGLGYARNSGLTYVKGEYVLFLDADDLFRPTLIENLVENLKPSSIDTSIGGFERISETGKDLGPYGKSERKEYIGEDVKRIMLPKLFGSLPNKHDGIVISACNTLYNMEIIRKYNIQFESERKYTSEDLFFNLEYFQHAKGVQFTGQREYLYRINPKSLSHSYRENRFNMKQQIYLEGCRRLEKAGIYEETKLRFMNYYLIGMKLCVRQEVPKIANKSYKECIMKIKTICENMILKDILQHYPINELGIKQRIFVMMLKHKMAKTLELMASIGILE